MKTSIVIPNFNGARLLEKNLPKVLSLGADEITVVDDGSKDQSVSLLKEKFPSVKVLINNENSGFSTSVNKGVEASTGDLIILLNNDVIPQNNLLEYVLPYFDNSGIFAVSFNEPNWSYAIGKFEKGYIEHYPGEKTNKPHISFWASGGSAIFSKGKWDQLKGFDNAYAPFYWEDIDLSYRAWKMGWEVWWEPKAIVEHKHQETIDSHFSKGYISYISQRNRLIFIWKNIKDKDLLAEHRKNLFVNLTKPSYWRTFIGALVKLPEVIGDKKDDYKISDKEIFNRFK